MAAALFVPPRGGAAFVDGSGHVYAGSKLNFYVTGTTTPLDTYTTSALSIANANPVVADSNGLFAAIYLTANTLYKVVFTTSAGVTIWTTDPVEGAPLTTTPSVGLLRSYLAGLTLSRNAGTPNTKIDVAAGACTDSTNALAMIITAGTIDTGTVGANGLDAGVLVLSTWYHIHAIAKVDGTTALLASTSASSPTLPAGYTLFRRIGSVRTDASVHFIDFVQDGDLFQWTATPISNFATANPGTSAVLGTVTTPLGVSTIATILVQVQNAGSAGNACIIVTDPNCTNVAPSIGSINDLGVANNVAGASANLSGRLNIRTNTSSQVRYRLTFSDANVTVGMVTVGYTDRRGRDS